MLRGSVRTTVLQESAVSAENLNGEVPRDLLEPTVDKYDGIVRLKAVRHDDAVWPFRQHGIHTTTQGDVWSTQERG